MMSGGKSSLVVAFIAALLAPCAIAADEGEPSDATHEARRLIASGASAFRQGHHAAAARDFAMAAALRPPDGLEASARLMQAKALASLARFEDAIVVLDVFLKLAPGSPETFEALILRGEALVGASATTPHFSEAALSFSMALETDGIKSGERALAALRLCDALLRGGDISGANKVVSYINRDERTLLAQLAIKEGNPRVRRMFR